MATQNDSDSNTVPSQFQIFPYGLLNLHGDKSVQIDEATMERLVDRFNARELDMVIDYEHQTEGGQFASPSGLAPAAGWIKKLINRGKEGLWAVVEWTEMAKKHIANKEYRYFSPVFYQSKEDGSVVELLRLALTNAPRFNGLRPLTAKVGVGPEYEQHAKIFAMCGVTEADVAKYSYRWSAPVFNESQDEVQARINRMCGVDDEMWRKYGPKE